jgi:hypothetical protein
MLQRLDSILHVTSWLSKLTLHSHSMQPTYRYRTWTKCEVGQLMKSKGTITDIDGEYFYTVSGQVSRNYHVAAHYRVPLRALNKKFGTYRKIVTHLTDSSHPLVAQVRDTYLSVMDYIHNVRISFCVDVKGSADPLGDGFRSPALDYYLWLDHIAGGFHDRCRAVLEHDHRVTFGAVQNRDVKDIISLRQ